MVELTEAARKRLAVMRDDPANAGPWLRIGVRGGGCSGLSYVMDWVPTPEEKDKVFEFDDGVRVCVDRKSYLFVNGIRVDFQDTLMRTGFVFENPNATSSCSCGESFSV